MPPIAGHNEHQWTRFELNTMLALMARGIHLDENPSPSSTSTSKPKKRTPSTTSTPNAYLTFATALNHALHGDRYQEDISKREVTRQLDKMLREKKQVVGRGGLMERQRSGRVTRMLRCAWESNRRAGSDGSLGEKRLREVEMGRGLGGGRAEGVQTVKETSSSTGRIQKKPGRNSAAVGKMGRYKSKAVVLDDDDEEDGISANAYTEMRVPASVGYAASPLHVTDTPTITSTTPFRIFSPEHACAPTPDIDMNIPPPGLTHDHSSPQEQEHRIVSSPEKNGSNQLPAIPEMEFGKAGGGGGADVVVDDDMARELEERMFGAAESGF